MLTAQQLDDNWLNSKHNDAKCSVRKRNEVWTAPHSAGLFIPTRPPGDRSMRSTQQQDDAWSDGLGEGYSEKREDTLNLGEGYPKYGGHLEPCI